MRIPDKNKYFAPIIEVPYGFGDFDIGGLIGGLIIFCIIIYSLLSSFSVEVGPDEEGPSIFRKLFFS